MLIRFMFFKVHLRRETRDVGRIRRAGASEASSCDQAVVLENIDSNLGGNVASFHLSL